jgi:catechol 2,3-dioxygenase-like lactoylglutathione lyase family enzyme
VGSTDLVLTVRDLDAAAAFYRRLGFRVPAGAIAIPGGRRTRYRAVFEAVFLELIGVEEHEKIPPHLGRSFSFGAFVRDALERGEGFAMLVLESADAESGRGQLRDGGHRGLRAGVVLAPGHATGWLRRPCGVHAGLRGGPAGARESVSFVCRRHYPENFWNPAFQAHPDGACGIPAATMVAENPAARAAFLYHFTGEHDLVSNSSGIAVERQRRLRRGSGQPRLALPHGPRATSDEPARLAGFQVRVRDLAALADRLRAEAIPFSLQRAARWWSAPNRHSAAADPVRAGTHGRDTRTSDLKTNRTVVAGSVRFGDVPCRWC